MVKAEACHALGDCSLENAIGMSTEQKKAGFHRIKSTANRPVSYRRFQNNMVTVFHRTELEDSVYITAPREVLQSFGVTFIEASLLTVHFYGRRVHWNDPRGNSAWRSSGCYLFITTITRLIFL